MTSFFLNQKTDLDTFLKMVASGLLLVGLVACVSPQMQAISSYCTAESSRLHPPMMTFTQEWQNVQVGERQVGTKRVCTQESTQVSNKNRQSENRVETCIDQAIMEPVLRQQLVNVPIDTNQANREAVFHVCRADALKKGMYQELNQKK
jgi:hypothetical protein